MKVILRSFSIGLSVLCLISTFSGCGKLEFQHSEEPVAAKSREIRNGTETIAEQYETVAGIFFRDPNNQTRTHCSLTLLSQRVGLTAAHCVVDPDLYWYNPAQFWIARDASESFGIKRASRSPNLTVNYGRSDVAILQLDRRVPVNGFYSIFDTNFTSTQLDDIAVGYGVDETNLSGVKRYGALHWVGTAGIDLLSYMPGHNNLNQMTCPGDSGGPTLRTGTDGKTYIIGVAHSINSQCQSATLGYHTSVYANASYIKSDFEKLSPPGACMKDDNLFTTPYNVGGCQDLRTARVWSAMLGGKVKTYSEAISYCQNLRDGGFSNWRLPTRTELQTMVTNEGGNLGIANHVMVSNSCWYAWSSTSSSSSRAYVVNYINQAISTSKSYRRSVICIR